MDTKLSAGGRKMPSFGKSAYRMLETREEKIIEYVPLCDRSPEGSLLEFWEQKEELP